MAAQKPPHADTRKYRFVPYPRGGDDTGVIACAIADDAICVQFRNGVGYVYSYACPGRVEVEQMKMLARAGTGLTTFISQQIQRRYEATWEKAEVERLLRASRRSRAVA
ncbi:hypothetical protein [Ideonella sp. BN130291]|uniref:hypothetical protein n=1 Tax=Ideonella sp. BN130291 TaxID=3112940 RepID=UPI002E2620D7|nr:hypothetical protein [Ideonella sp. BN130291]